MNQGSEYEIRLTAYSHGSGCGCKISPAILEKIIQSPIQEPGDPRLIVGNESQDDAAVYAFDDHNVIISTTDFFMPIVDDPFDFGVIASVNAISDIYAMGGSPIMALSILGWPLDKLSPDIARIVVEGARHACRSADITLAGGHSIDSPEPVFGLAVTGIAAKEHIKTNNTAVPGCELFLTKPIGTGILTTARKKGLLPDNHLKLVIESMKQLNKQGAELGKCNFVKAMTDVTGFGLLGHLIEMCEGSRVSAEIRCSHVPVFGMTGKYVERGIFPGGTQRNFESYGGKVNEMPEEWKIILCDPQTSGGLLVAVDPAGQERFLQLMERNGSRPYRIGKITERTDKAVLVK